MRLCFCVLFLTLVLRPLELRAAPGVSDSPPGIPSTDELKVKQELSAPDAPITTAPVPLDEIYDWSARFGMISGVFNEGAEQKMFQFVGLRFDFNKKFDQTWQGELKIGNNNFIQATLGKKFPFVLETVTSPYYKFSGGELFGPTEGIGSLVNIKKLQAIAAIGMDDFFLLHHRLQMEVAVNLAAVGPQLEFSLGLAF